jgi:Leucine-rich repeat (LRR) protein
MFYLYRILEGPANCSLSELRLGGNAPKIDPSWCVNLDSLDLTGCGLDHIPKLLQFASQLTYISIDNNDISDISLLILNRKLKVLQVAKNQLSNICHVSDVIAKLPHISVLDIRYLETEIGGMSSFQQRRIRHNEK